MICCIIEWNGLLDMNVVDVANVSLSFLLNSQIVPRGLPEITLPLSWVSDHFLS